MSASLVGSEMCIRDSGRSARESAGALRSDSEVPPFEREIRNEEPVLEACLLYTSDAADDM
eukprot:12004754-Alexandrium_andersonii.AAC.1